MTHEQKHANAFIFLEDGRTDLRMLVAQWWPTKVVNAVSAVAGAKKSGPVRKASWLDALRQKSEKAGQHRSLQKPSATDDANADAQCAGAPQ